MIMEMCTAPAMMAAPTMNVRPEKTRGPCMWQAQDQRHFRPLIKASLSSQTCTAADSAAGGRG